MCKFSSFEGYIQFLKQCFRFLFFSFSRGLGRKYAALVKRLRTAKKGLEVGEKPACINTHLRDMIIVPEMIGSIVGVYNGKVFNAVEIQVSLCVFLICSIL